MKQEDTASQPRTTPHLMIRNAEQATDRALSFVRERSPYGGIARPMRAVRDGQIWSVELDLGIIRVMVATIKIHAETAEIMEHSIPPEYSMPPLGTTTVREGSGK